MAKGIQKNFSGGVVNDPRDTTLGVARVVTNFDINTSPNRLIPYRSSEDGNSNSANDLMQNWCIALRTGSTYSLYGLGRQTASNLVRIFYKNITTGASTDLDDNGWTETANNLAAQATPAYNLFIYYKKTGYIYGAHTGTHIYRYDPSGSGAFSDTHQALAYTNIAQGLVHSQDDILYIFYDNKVASNNNGTWTTAALTLPSDYYITSGCENGTYIDIAAAPLSGIGESRMYRWDRSTTLATITENINWGAGNLKVVEELDGFTVGISLDGANSTRFNDRVTFKYYTGAGAKSFFTLLGASATVLSQNKQKINNRLYFMMSLSLNGTVREGVWSFGKNPNGQGFNLVHERTPNNDTALSGGALRGFFYIGDYLFQAFTIAAGTHTVTKTDDTANYSHTSIVETVINPDVKDEDIFKQKQLVSIILRYAPLPAAGQVVCKYKVDGGSYTTVFTETTDGVLFTESQDAAGVPFTFGRDYEFRLESSGGAEIIGHEFNYQNIPTLA